MYFPFIKYRRIFYIISIILVIVSIISIFVFGLNFGIEFTGGGLLELEFRESAPTAQAVREKLAVLNLGELVVQRVGEKGIAIKMKETNERGLEEISAKLSELAEIEPGSESFQTIGAVIGKELKEKTRLVVILSLLSILFYIAFSFRRVKRPVKSYVYGITSLLALFHDVLIPLGVFALLGRFLAVEITIPIITALLIVFGYSINDTVVVFDRIRENILKLKEPTFDLTVEKSLNQSLVRSLNTSFTTLLVLLAIFFLGGETLRYFALALILGIGFGTYSSLFLASPLLTTYLRLKDLKDRKDRKPHK